MRAISDLSLFTDEEDTQFYTDILYDIQHKGYCEVYAYALFPTHVHILLKEGVQEISKVKDVSENIVFTENSRSVHGNSRSKNEDSSLSSSPEPIGSIMKRIASAYSYFFTNIGEYLQRPDEAQEEAIRNCKKEGGSIRQIVRLTGHPSPKYLE